MKYTVTHQAIVEISQEIYIEGRDSKLAMEVAKRRLEKAFEAQTGNKLIDLTITGVRRKEVN
jgi:hypothetical protein